MGGDYRRVLAIQLRRLGDLVLATPALRAVRRSWPECRLTVLTERPFDEVLAGNPDVDETLIHPRGALPSALLGARLGRMGFDLALDFHGNPTSARLTLQSRAGVRVGWRLRGRRLAYSTAMPVPDPDPPRYTGSLKIDLVRAAGGGSADSGPAVHLNSAEIVAARERLDRLGLVPGEPFLAVAPVSRRRYKQWPSGDYAATIGGFIRETRAPAVLLGGPGDEETLEGISRSVAPARVLICPAGSVREMIALLHESAAFLGPDGGPKHLAQALGLPTLALFGPQAPATWTLPTPDGRHRWLGGRLPGCVARCSREAGPCRCLLAVEPRLVVRELGAMWAGRPRGAPVP